MSRSIPFFICIFFVFLISCTPQTESTKGNTQHESFTKVKNLLLKKVYNTHRITFYCGCDFTPDKKVLCKTGKGKRASRIEWEHIVPASRFGKTFDAWKKYTPLKCKLPNFLKNIFGLKCKTLGGRENARRVSQKYRLMESDMYNLAPAIGLVNQRRLNYPYGIVPGEKREFGRCDFEVEKKVAEPMDSIRGNIARTYFYMDAAYPKRLNLSAKEKKMFEKWDTSDPVDNWECERCKKIEALQGNINPFVKTPCQEKGLW